MSVTQGNFTIAPDEAAPGSSDTRRARGWDQTMGYKRRALTGTIHALSSTICRMKIIIFLVLAALSLAAGNSDTNPAYKWQCMFDGLKKTPDALKALGKFLCEHSSGTEIKNVENYKQTFAELKETMTNLGCHADAILGTEATVENLGENVTAAAEHAWKVSVHLTDALELTPKATELLCMTLGERMFSDCTDHVVQNIDTLVTEVDDMFCKGEYLSPYNTFTHMQNLGCVADEAVGSEDVMKDLFTKLGDSLVPTVNKAVNNLCSGLQKKGILDLSGLVCSVINIAGGEAGEDVPIVQGGISGVRGITGGLSIPGLGVIIDLGDIIGEGGKWLADFGGGIISGSGIPVGGGIGI